MDLHDCATRVPSPVGKYVENLWSAFRHCVAGVSYWLRKNRNSTFIWFKGCETIRGQEPHVQVLWLQMLELRRYSTRAVGVCQHGCRYNCNWTECFSGPQLTKSVRPLN